MKFKYLAPLFALCLLSAGIARADDDDNDAVTGCVGTFLQETNHCGCGTNDRGCNAACAHEGVSICRGGKNIARNIGLSGPLQATPDDPLACAPNELSSDQLFFADSVIRFCTYSIHTKVTKTYCDGTFYFRLVDIDPYADTQVKTNACTQVAADCSVTASGIPSDAGRQNGHTFSIYTITQCNCDGVCPTFTDRLNQALQLALSDGSWTAPAAKGLATTQSSPQAAPDPGWGGCTGTSCQSP